MSLDVENTMIEQAPWCVVDTETTGLDGLMGEIVEVSFLRFEFIDGVRVFSHSLSTLIKPIEPIDEEGEAYRVNGIGNALVANAPTWQEVAEQAAAFIRGAVVIAHNLPFDADFLLHAQRRADQPFPIVAGVCTLSLMKRYKRAVGLIARSNRLQDLLKVMKPTPQQVAETFSQKFEQGEHRAEADAWGCFALWYHHLLPHMTLEREITVELASKISGIEVMTHP